MFWLILFNPTPNFAAEPALLNDQIKNLTAAFDVDPAATAKDQTVQASLLLLLAKIGAVPCEATGDPNTFCKIKQSSSYASGVVTALHGTKISDDQIKGLHAALDPLLTLVPPGDDTGLTSAMDAATKIANAKAVVSPADVATALDNLVKALQTQIAVSKPAKTLPQDKLDPAIKTMGDVSTNLGLILRALGANDNLIRITGAWYGDLSAIRQTLKYGDIRSFESNSRYCSATRAVRARCQGKAQCYEPADSAASGSAANSGDGNTSEIDGAHLCGYEPAPFAEPNKKGLIVRYECLSPEDGTWIAAALGDDIIPAPPVEQGRSDAQLRIGVVASIRCQPPALAAVSAIATAPDNGGAKKQTAPTGTIAITVSGTVPGTVTGTATGAAGQPAPATQPAPAPSGAPSPAPAKGSTP